MKIEKVEKLVAKLHDKTAYVIDIINLKQALNHRLALKKVHRVIKPNQNLWLKPYIDKNTNLVFGEHICTNILQMNAITTEVVGSYHVIVNKKKVIYFAKFTKLIVNFLNIFLILISFRFLCWYFKPHY